jgi:hypothetical protein
MLLTMGRPPIEREGADMGGAEDDDAHLNLLRIGGAATGHGGLGMEEASDQSNPIHLDSTGLAE